MSAPPNCKLIGRWRIVEADNDDGSIEIEFAYHGQRRRSLSSRRNRYFFNSLLVQAKLSRRPDNGDPLNLNQLLRKQGDVVPGRRDPRDLEFWRTRGILLSYVGPFTHSTQVGCILSWRGGEQSFWLCDGSHAILEADNGTSAAASARIMVALSLFCGDHLGIDRFLSWQACGRRGRLRLPIPDLARPACSEPGQRATVLADRGFAGFNGELPPQAG